MPPDDRGPCKPSDNTNGGWNNFRLPDYMVPFHYDLHLEPNLDTDIYTGSVSIHLTLTQPSQHLWLHIRETFVTAVPSLQRSGPSGLTSVRVKECFEYKPQEYVVVEASEQLSVTGPGRALHPHSTLPGLAQRLSGRFLQDHVSGEWSYQVSVKTSIVEM